MFERCLTQAEIFTLFDEIKVRRYRFRDQALFTMNILAGLRAFELAIVRVSDVLAENGEVKAEWDIPAEPRSYKSRTAFFNEETKKAIREYLESEDLMKEQDRLLFGEFFGNRMLGNKIRQRFRSCGIRKAGAETGKRTLIAALRREGAPPNVIDSFNGEIVQSPQDRAVIREYIERINLENIGAENEKPSSS